MALLIGLAIGSFSRHWWRAATYIFSVGAVLGALRWQRIGFVSADLGIPMSSSAAGSVALMILLVAVAAALGFCLRLIGQWVAQRL